MDLSKQYEIIFDGIFQELGLADLSPEAKQKMAARMHESLEKAVVTRIIAELPEMTEEQYKALADNDLTKMLAENNIDPVMIATQEAAVMQDQLKQVVNFSKGYLEGLQDGGGDKK